LIALIGLYRALVSPLLPHACRFHPSCSEYAVVVIRMHGAVEGAVRAARRLARCRPGCAGGLDLP
jgi:putative membrane protein insertion efficiency factor